MSTTAIVPVGQYAIAQVDPAELLEIIEANLGGESINVFKLPRLKVPSGGQTFWSVPTLEGGEEPVREFEGVIVYFDDRRGLWKKSIEEGGGGQPPDCSGRLVQVGGLEGAKEWKGFGNRDGDENMGPHDCATCPYGQFGSDPKGGKGKWCKDTRMIAIMGPDSLLPTICVVPPSSLADIKAAFMRLLAAGVPYYGVKVGLSLVPAKNEGGIAYSKIALRVIERCSPEQKAKFRQISNDIKPWMAKVEEYVTVEGDEAGSSFAADEDMQDISTDE